LRKIHAIVRSITQRLGNTLKPTQGGGSSSAATLLPTSGRRLDDLQSPSKSLLYPLTYLAVIAPVGPYFFHPRQRIADLLKQELRSFPIGDVRLVDRYHDHQAFCVNEQMPLSTADLLASIVAADAALLTRIIHGSEFR
jgi:hypothetical protein